MNQEEIIQSVRAEIVKLQQVLDLLLGGSMSAASPAGVIRRPGRPKGSGSRATVAQPKTGTSTKRTMSEEGRARIAAAQKKRWAASKALVSGRNAEKRSSPVKAVRKAVPLKLARTAAPAKAQRSARAGRRVDSTQTQAQAQLISAKKATSGAGKIPSNKSTAKKSTRQASRQPAKQVPAGAPESQA